MSLNKIQVDITNITVKLPEGYFICSEEEYNQLKKQASEGKYMTLNDVLELLSVSRPWLLENVLYKSTIRKQIDIDQNQNGFVKYPKNKGGRYFFLASKTKSYFETHFKDIFI